ncbi:MAG: hypothetical protein MHM6MM_006344 [Cercozoa sp. M6MM]
MRKRQGERFHRRAAELSHEEASRFEQLRVQNRRKRAKQMRNTGRADAGNESLFWSRSAHVLDGEQYMKWVLKKNDPRRVKGRKNSNAVKKVGEAKGSGLETSLSASSQADGETGFASSPARDRESEEQTKFEELQRVALQKAQHTLLASMHTHQQSAEALLDELLRPNTPARAKLCKLKQHAPRELTQTKFQSPRRANDGGHSLWGAFDETSAHQSFVEARTSWKRATGKLGDACVESQCVTVSAASKHACTNEQPSATRTALLHASTEAATTAVSYVCCYNCYKLFNQVKQQVVFPFGKVVCSNACAEHVRATERLVCMAAWCHKTVLFQDAFRVTSQGKTNFFCCGAHASSSETT